MKTSNLTFKIKGNASQGAKWYYAYVDGKPFLTDGQHTAWACYDEDHARGCFKQDQEAKQKIKNKKDMETLTAKSPARISKLGSPAIITKLQNNVYEGEQREEALAILRKRNVDVSEFEKVEVKEIPTPVVPEVKADEVAPALAVEASEEKAESKSDKIKRMLKSGTTPAAVKKSLIEAGISVHYSEIHRIKVILEKLRS